MVVRVEELDKKKPGQKRVGKLIKKKTGQRTPIEVSKRGTVVTYTPVLLQTREDQR